MAPAPTTMPFLSELEKHVFPQKEPTSEELVVCGVIGSKDIPPCPCCNRQVSKAETRQTLDEPTTCRRSDIPCAFDLEEEVDEGDEDFLPGVLDSGVEYRIKRVLAEGWVHKKGTGQDFFGSRAWKPRWARLALAKVEGFTVDMPLLMVYWYQSTPTPSTVIMLDSTVVMPVDKNTESCNPYCFDVVHVKDKVTRTFSAPQIARDRWVYAMNSVLLRYEKDSAQARKEAAALADLRPTSPTPSYFFHEPLSPPRPMSPPPSPPMSPTSLAKRPLPRPDKLIGESLLEPPCTDCLLGESFLEDD